MPLTDFEVQTNYPDYAPLAEWRDASVATATAPIIQSARDAVAKCNAIIAKLQDVNSTKEDALIEVDKAAKNREIEELTKQKEVKVQEIVEIDAKIEELNK